MSHQDQSQLEEFAGIGVEAISRDTLTWKCLTEVAKFYGDNTSVEPYEILTINDNLLMYGGASCLWQCLIGNGTTTADQVLTYFNNARAALGVGDSTTAAVATHTDLQAASNKLRKAMDATYPIHTDATTSGAASIVYRSTFATSDANYAWEEWATFNTVTAATGRMLQRKVQSLGTKTSAATWQLTVTLTLA